MVKQSLTVLLLSGAACFGNAILVSPNPLTVPALSPTGVSFTYSGTLTSADTLSLIQTGDPCLQSGPQYCNNGAGIVTTAGVGGAVGTDGTFSGTFGGFTGTWTYGSLLISISGVGTEEVFLANAGNGLGSGTPPLTLNLPTTSLASLGFGPFSVVSPTITFFVADNNYPDNTGSFSLSQSSGVPEPGSVALLGSGLIGLALFKRRASR